MAENSIAKLKAKRSSIKGKLTRFENYLKGVNPDELNDTIINEIQARLNKLEPIYDEFDELQSEIEQQIIENQMQSETESESAEAERNEFENRYFKLVGEMNALLNEHNNMNDNVSNHGTPQGSVRGSSHSVALQQNNNSLQSVVRLPPIKLPEFDGQYSNWLEFKDLFNALVDGNLALNNVQKFYYLRSSLGKEVLNIIKSLEVTDTNYDIAWQILKERFENKGLIIHNHVRAIFEHPIISKESYTDLRNLSDAITKHLRALNSLGESTDFWDRLIIYIMCSKFDNTTRRDWEAFKCVGELPTMNDLNSFLKTKCEVLEKLEVAKLDLSKYNPSKTLNKKGKEFSANYAATEKTYNNKFKCYFCNQTSHGIYKCNSFLKLPVAERIHAVKERKLCLNCFTDTHPSWKCSKSKCNKCHKAHNSILHLDFYKNSSNQNTSSAHGANNISQTQVINNTNGASGATSAGPHQEDSSTCSFNAEQCEVAGCTERGPDVGKTELAASATSKYSQVLLSTAIIKISNDNGKTITARALLDSGSQGNFISKHICNELNLNEVQINHAVKGVGQTLTNINHKVNVRIESCINKFYTNIDCLVIPSITERLPTISFKKNILKIPNLELADPNFNISGEIDILLGSNIFWTILGSNQVRLGPKMPTLHESKFGYIIAGDLNLKGILTESEASLSCLNILDSDNSIDSKIVKFWEIEEVNYKIDSMSESEKHCEKFFHDTTTRDHSENLLQAPRFTTFTSSSIIRLGTTKIVQCQAYGNPPPQFKWLKDGTPITEFSTDPFYKIISARHEDGGSYRCIAANKIGSILSEEIKIVVAYMDVFKNQSETTVSIQEGDAAVLNLPEIDSVPAPDVTWQTDEGVLPYAQKYAKSKTNQLIILSTDKSDQKPYRARAINSQEGKEENSAFIRLIIEDSQDYKEVAPEIIIAPDDLQIVKGSSEATLDCIANARPLYELETLWFKDGIPIENAGISYSLNDIWNRSLALVSINTTHSGQYECSVNLRSGGFPPAKALAQVVVLEKPKFFNNAKPETLGDYGSPKSLPCDVIGIPKPNITWYKNAEELDLNDKRYVVEEDNSLLIKKLLITDNGMYQCFARNKAGESSLSTWLRVKTAQPVMEFGPKNLTVLDGKDATLTCRAAGAPVPNVTWIFNEEEEVRTSSRVQILDTGDLLIAAVRESDAGQYTCVRANEAGEVRGSSHLIVLVRTQIVQPPVDTRVLLGHTATLQCKISSDPAVPYQLDWFRNKQMINPKGSQRINILSDGMLEIQAVRAADVGHYTCAVKSPGGNETRSAKLSVIELPFAPTNVKAERVEADGQRAVNVSWTPGFDGNSPIKQYIVQKREVPEFGPIPDPLLNWVTELSNVSGDQRWTLLTNLKAAASYQFRVSAINSVGEGSPSVPSNQVMLPQEAPSGPPVGFVGSARSSSEIITQWQPPLEEHRNGQILGYIIRYRLYGYNDSPWTIRNITNEAQRNYLITDLITWKDYIVQIAAYNNKGVGVFTDGAKIKTKEGVPEAPPIIQKVEAINSTVVQIWWIPPDPQKINGINQGYKIQAWRWIPDRGLKEASMMTVHPNLLDPYAEQSALMTHLEKFTEYNITVLCFTDPGDGEISDFVSVKTKEDVPDEVGSLQFDDISDRAVKVLWQPPKKINGILTGYQIQYHIKDMPETNRIKNLSADTLSIKITELQATTHYKFEVTAWTAVGPGPPKVAIIQSGVEPVLPHPPSKLALSNIEAFSVVLQFTPGFDGNSSITKWTVQAQTARNATWFTVYEISDPDATTITVTGLVPFTLYKLRLIANNVVGASVPSEATKEFQTIQAPPAHPPKNVTVRAMSATELRVRWIPLQQIEWFGNPRGYNITYIEVRTGFTYSATIEDHTANSHVIIGLEEFALYEIRMQACNDVGCSSPGPKAIERTRESVPSFGPMNVLANATSSTTIVVKWGDVPKEHQNGLIEGFKVYYAAESKSSVDYKVITNNMTFTTTLTELRKYVVYHIQVLAYTRLGDGEPSKPAVSVRTYEDVPGAPSNVSFPDVSFTSARIIWDVPEEPNGEILAYKVTYHINNVNTNNKYSKEFPPPDRTFRFTQLEPEKYYMFSVTAQTRLGWGKTAHALVYTTNNREPPQPPSVPQISRSQIQSRAITFSWTPGRDGFAPLRYYTVQKMESSGPWQSLPERVDPQLTSYTVTNLKPYTKYSFRIQATNDIGPSRFSPESVEVRTYPAAPSKAISNLKAVPITTTSVEVFWVPVEEQYWSGDTKTGGYRVVFQPVSDFPTALQATPKEEVMGINASKMVLSELLQDRNYEIIVVPFNIQGEGPASPPVTVYVGEAVPTGEPRGLQGEPVSSTEVRLRWKPPQQHMQNGELLGYKIFYTVINSPQELEEGKKWEEEIEVVAASTTSHSLVFLDKYTEYKIQILAFNPAGDGPRSQPITVKTLQGLPSAPVNLRFTEITMNSLVVIWDPPKKPNGDIIGYIVTYETTEENERFSKQVKQKVSTNFLQVQSLEEEITYTFTVRAQTIDYGPPISNNVTTGPQDGSPGSPKELIVIKTISSVDMHWLNGPTGKGPILGYYIESQRKEDTRWQTVTKTNNGPLQEFTISYQSLLPSTAYIFRVIPYNKFGISCPAVSQDSILTPSKLYMEYGYLQHRPFYRQTWFMVALAAISVIIIITIIAILCVKSKSYKYKQEAQKTLEESMAMSLGDHQELALDYYRSKSANGTISAMGTLSKRTGQRKQQHNQPPPILGKSPPRPSPASVPYNSDEESLKGYDENPDDSSVTEKPSEMSSSEQGSESENESVRSDPHSFVNHYANVNDTLRQSWKRQKPVKNYSSYTDSEPEGSAVVSLNGGQIILNNMARSRAPLPGFSSFV